MRVMGSLYAVLALVGMSHFAAAKSAPITEEDRTIVQVFEAPGYTKDQIFAATKMWIAENFKSAKAVIEYENKDEGTIIGNGIIRYPCGGAFACMAKGDWTVPFTMRAESKDGRFRLTFTNIHLAWPASYSSGISTPAHDGPVNQRSDLDKIRPELLKFGEQLLTSMSKAKSSDDW